MSCSCQDLASKVQGNGARSLLPKLKEVKTTKFLTVIYQCESCHLCWEKQTLTAEHIGGGYFILEKMSVDYTHRRQFDDKLFNISQALRSEFYELKSEVLKRLKSHMGVYIYHDEDKGEGFSMDYDDKLCFKFYPMTGAGPGPCDVEDVVEAYQTFKKHLSDEECVVLAIERFKQLISANQFPYFS